MRYTCFVIGEGTLLIDCTTILYQQGFLVKGVISPDPQVRSYCAKDGLRYIDPLSGFAAVLNEEPFDFLFSIVNSYILPETILQLPRRHTINYHDAPLPAYAGVHATFWALVNGEKTHGITWHLVETGIDTGAVAKQRLFPIDPDETSISLNVKSYAAAVESFRELVDELVADKLVIQPQDLSRRSYYPRKKRPDLLINWSQEAAVIVRLQRALDFGFHANPFGYLKIWAGNRFVLVKEITATTTPSSQPPGTVEAILPDSLLVATDDYLLAFGAFQTVDGELLSVAAFCEEADLAEGQLLPAPAPELIQAYRKADRLCAPYQPFWVDKLVQFQPTTLPWPAPASSSKDLPADAAFVNIDLRTDVEAALAAKKTLVGKTDWLIATLLLTLARLNNQLSVDVGYRSARSAQTAADTAGAFAEYVPLRIAFNWESGIEEAVTQVRQEQAMIGKHLTYARETMVCQPILQTIAQEFRSNGFSIVICQDESEVNRVRLKKALTVLIDNDTYRVVFNPVVWPAHWVTDFVNRWMILLGNVAQQSTQPLKTIRLLTQEEQRRMLIDWNATAIPYPRDQAVHQLVEAQVQQWPQAEALRCGTVMMTYEQLNQRANQLAWYLQKRGITPRTLVGLCTERSPDMIVSLLAILKAGGAYVPLDPAYPANRLKELATQTGVRYVITRKTWLDRLPAQGNYILLNEDRPQIDQQSIRNLNTPVQAEQLAYVLFTSGSTGRPKGVAIPHRAVVRLIRGTNFMRLDETVSMLGLAPLAFDASTLEVWGSLANGGRLVLIEESPPSLDLIKQTIQAHQVNAAFFTTALFNVLVDHDIRDLTTLTQLLTGGEAASAEHVLRARRQLPACALINGYGPTESTTFASYYTMSDGDWKTGSVPIGTPISNTQLYIVDAFLNPVPVGVPGELLIGGDGLAREYIHESELTAQKFIPDPFRNQSGNRLYRTGDQARYLADGTIEFLGRLDDQLKIRGHRIEPGEVEQALCQHSTVGEAVVLADGPAAGTKRLVAYVVPKPGMAIQPEVLRAFLKTSLPDYLIPNMLVPIPEIPLTANGKVDKARLPSAFKNSPRPESDLLTPTERAMEPLWASVLSQPSFAGSDHFFELGGSSLMAIQLIALIFRQFGLRLSMNDVFKHPTLRELSTYVDQLPRQTVSTAAANPVETRSAARLPLSPAQNRLWVIEQLYDLQGVYNVPLILDIQGPLDRLALQQSLNEIIRRHDILRTSFGHIDGVPFQRIAPALSLEITVSRQTADMNQTLTQWLTDESYRPFDLTEGPLVRASLAQLSEESWLFLLVFHHIIYDGVSTRVLAHELQNHYSAFLRNRPVTLPSLPYQYTDYVQWQLDHHKPEKLNRERVYWKNHLANVPTLVNLPTDKPRPAIQSFAGADYSFSLPDELWQQIRTGLQRPATTVFLRLLTVFAVWLHRIAKTSDVVMGIPVAGRDRPEWDALIGFFVNTLVIRIEVSEELTFRQLLRKVQQIALEAYDHQALPFEQLVEEIKPPRNLAYSPLVQVIFNVEENNAQYWKLDELAIEEIQPEKNTAKFDLQLTCRETADGLVGTFNYRVDLFNEETVVQMTQCFIDVFRFLVMQPDQPLWHLPGADAITQSFGQEIHPEENIPHLDPPTDAPPLDQPIVSLLERIWVEVLDVPSVGLDDDFFALGGHSLLVVQLTAAIQKQSGYRLPVAAVFANPTLRQLAIYLKTTQANVVWESLVPIRTQGDRPALFLVHPLSGDVAYAYQLAPYLSDQQPIYGLRAVGLDGITEPLPSIEEMAAYYVRLIIEQQPQGPYSIGGFSLGGIIAFEMARQLKQIGKDVNVLVLIDCYPVNPDAENHTKFPIRQLLPHYYYYWRSLPKRPAVLLPILRQKIPWVSQYLFSRVVQRLYKKEDSFAGSVVETSPAEPENPLLKTLRQAYSQYRFRPYDGKVVFMRVAKNETFADDLNKVDFGWGRYVRKGVEVHQLVGNHQSLFSQTATIRQIAAIIQSYLTPEGQAKQYPEK